MNRRHFIRSAAAAGAALSFPAIVRGRSPNSKIVVGVMGVSRSTSGGNGRGCELALSLGTLPNVEVAYLSDVFDLNLAKALSVFEQETGRRAKGESDFRRILEDKSVDALVIAAPDHWHGPAGVMACSAGKHVYVEAPCSYNPEEGQALVAAGLKYGRVVQHGTQRRSWPAIREAIAAVQGGLIGRISLAQARYFSNRTSIGRGDVAKPPTGLDWALWQGPAPERPYHDNYFPYNWRWFWHWGTGELGATGVHLLDLCRWGLGVTSPERVAAGGQKLAYDDDQETPDTGTATFDFTGDKPCTIEWENRSWAARTLKDVDYDVAFFGEGGSILIQGSGFSVRDSNGRELSKGVGRGGDDLHLQNFAEAIRGTATLNAGIEEGDASTLLCHLGNIAWRTRHTLHFDPVLGLIADDPEASKLWRREYQPGWSTKV
jgi:predicted dehydrogenase